VLSSTVRDLVILIDDSDVAKRSRVSRTVSGCFAVLRQLRRVRRSVSESVFHSLVVTLRYGVYTNVTIIIIIIIINFAHSLLFITWFVNVILIVEQNG